MLPHYSHAHYSPCICYCFPSPHQDVRCGDLDYAEEAYELYKAGKMSPAWWEFLTKSNPIWEIYLLKFNCNPYRMEAHLWEHSTPTYEDIPWEPVELTNSRSAGGVNITTRQVNCFSIQQEKKHSFFLQA